jgi:uncharacterized membrane protein
MNPIALLHLCAAAVAIGMSVPLILRKVKMNPWYGVRIPEALKSDEAWFELNHYGGRLLLGWGFVVAIVAGGGLLLEKQVWSAYNWSALVLILGSLMVVVAKIHRYARRWEQKQREAGFMEENRLR